MANSSKKNSDRRTKPASTARPETAEPAAKPATSPSAARPAAASPAATSQTTTSPNPGQLASVQGKAQPRAETQGRSPTQEQIAKRAYQIFEARGAQHGRHAEDWKQAEQELKLGTQ